MAKPIDAGTTQQQAIRGFGPWQDFVLQNFPWLVVDHGDSDFKACARFRPFGDGSLAAMTANACRVTRDARSVRGAESGHLKVMWQRAGTMGVEQDGRDCLLRAGMATICDTGRPYRLTLSNDARLVVLTLPYRAIIGWERLSQNVCGAPVEDRAVFGAALAASLFLLEDAASQTGDGVERVIAGIEAMLSSSLHASTDQRRLQAVPLEMRGIEHHIKTHIDDPDLNPDELATALRVSRRTLYNLFQEQSTTPSRFIRDVRLDAVRRALIDPQSARKTILEIALDHGFTDSASFCRTFKAAYGVSPSAWRARAMVVTAEDSDS